MKGGTVSVALELVQGHMARPLLPLGAANVQMCCRGFCPYVTDMPSTYASSSVR